MSRIKQQARIDAQVALDMNRQLGGNETLSFKVVRETKRSSSHTFGPPRVIAKCSLLADAKALIRARVERGIHTDEVGRAMIVRYSIELNGKTYSATVIGDDNETL